MCVKRTFAMAAWVALLAATPVFGDVAGLVAALSGDDAGVRAQAFEGAGQYGPEAIGPVAALLDDENVAVVRAAKIALERIVGPAADAARAPETVRREAGEALCNAAQSVKSKPGRDWLLWLLSYTGGPETVPYLVGLMDTPEDFNMALLALQGIGGSEVTHALLGKLPGANVPRRVAIINALGAIGDADAVGPLIEEARWSGPAACAAIGALGRIGRIDAVDVLWPKIQSDPCTCAVSAYLQIAERQKQAVAAKLYRRLLSASLEPQIQCAALAGLGKTGGARIVTTIIPFLAAERADVYSAAQTALVDLQGPRVDKKLKALFSHSTETVKAALLGILEARDPEGARPFIMEALRDGTAELRVTANVAPSFEFESTYLEAARSTSDSQKLDGVRKYLILADQSLDGGQKAKALEMYHTALEMATENLERIHALEGMTKIADRASMPLLEKLLENDEPAKGLMGSIGNCALSIAEAASETDPAYAQQVFESWAERGASAELARRVGAGLRKLGIEINMAARAGFISKWRLIGPFPLANFGDSFPPEHAYKSNATYPGAGGKQVGWQDFSVDDPIGVVYLRAVFQPNENVAAYARAVVTAPKAQDVLIKIGSDDGVVCWLNGEKIHENPVVRGLTIDQDVVRASLKSGENVLLVKIAQAGGEWAFCVRIADRSGKPIDFSK